MVSDLIWDTKEDNLESMSNKWEAQQDKDPVGSKVETQDPPTFHVVATKEEHQEE